MDKRLILIFVIFLLLSIAVASLRGGYITIFNITGFPLSSLIGFILLGIGTVWCIEKYRSKIKLIFIIFFIWLGVSILDLIFRIPNFSSSLISFPNLIIWWLGILIGYIYTILKNNIGRICLTVISLSFVLWCSGPGYWLFLHKLNFGTFNGHVKEYLISPIVFNNQYNENIDLFAFKSRYIILDFWHSYCGVCFEEFPKVQEIYDEIKADNNVLLYSVHCFDVYRNEIYKTGNDILQKEGYSFPCLSLPINGYIVELLNIKAYPTILIIDKKLSRIIYRGSIELAKEMVDKLQNNSFEIQ